MKRLLVVDDEPAIRALVTASLADCEVASAPDGATALASLAADLPDVILLDVALPGLNGNEVLRRLRSEDRTASIPVILLTGLEPPEDMTPDAVLRKPFTPLGLRQSVEPYLS
jgi:CheY-like chemotaxis protein